jgi:general stress protein YciG
MNNKQSDPSTEVSATELVPDPAPRPAENAPAARRPRGFAAMDRRLVSEIARKGGKAAHSAGKAHEFTSEEARAAGRKGGQATHAKLRRQREELQSSTKS